MGTWGSPCLEHFVDQVLHWAGISGRLCRHITGVLEAGLPELEDLDLRSVPDVEVVINACPALRLRMAHLTLNP
jgi:hypothetical protein